MSRALKNRVSKFLTVVQIWHLLLWLKLANTVHLAYLVTNFNKSVCSSTYVNAKILRFTFFKHKTTYMILCAVFLLILVNMCDLFVNKLLDMHCCSLNRRKIWINGSRGDLISLVQFAQLRLVLEGILPLNVSKFSTTSCKWTKLCKLWEQCWQPWDEMFVVYETLDLLEHTGLCRAKIV